MASSTPQLKFESERHMLLMLPVTFYMKEDEGTFLSNWESRKGGEAVMTTLDGG